MEEMINPSIQELELVEPSFFQSNSVLEHAYSLLGMFLVTRFDDGITWGRITEVEAYVGTSDRASHVFGGRKADRTRVFYENGGIAYVYLCYGIHHLFNIVTGDSQNPHAILIRSVQPCGGMDIMLRRRNMTAIHKRLTTGPGSLSKALGIFTAHNGMLLDGSRIGIYSHPKFSNPKVIATPRIGVDYAGEDALLPYRFIVLNSKWISGSRKVNRGPHPNSSSQ